MVPLWSQNTEECKKKFVTFFSKVVSPISMKFGMMGATGVAGLFGEFWPTFLGSTNF